MDFYLSLPNSSQITLLGLTEVRLQVECCSKEELFIFPTFGSIPNTLTGGKQLVVIVPFLASHCCEKEHQLALLLWQGAQCGRSPISKSNWCKPSPTMR